MVNVWAYYFGFSILVGLLGWISLKVKWGGVLLAMFSMLAGAGLILSTLGNPAPLYLLRNEKLRVLAFYPEQEKIVHILARSNADTFYIVLPWTENTKEQLNEIALAIDKLGLGAQIFLDTKGGQMYPLPLEGGPPKIMQVPNTGAPRGYNLR